MPKKHDCRVHNTSDLPLCITDPDTGEVYSIMPGYSTPAHTSWPDVLQALRTPGKAQLRPLGDGKAVVSG